MTLPIDNGFQCTDMTRQYCLEVLGKNYLPYGNAGTLFTQDWGDDYIKYENTPDFLPLEGDICIWSGPTVYGHIGVVVDADLSNMLILDQNTGSGNGDGIGNNAIRQHIYNYKTVIGFIRHKSLIIEKETMEQFGKLITVNGFTFPKSVYGIPVRLAKTGSKTLMGKAKIKGYLPGCKKDEILIFTNSFKKGNDYLLKILFHEMNHFLVHKLMPKKSKQALIDFSNYSTDPECYVSEYAKSQPAEDIAETWAYGKMYIDKGIALPENKQWNDKIQYKYELYSNICNKYI